MPSQPLSQQDLYDLNELLAGYRIGVQESLRSAIPLKGFVSRLPPLRGIAGTDELLARAQVNPTFGRVRKSIGWSAAYYWENLDRYFPAHSHIDDELPDPTESVRPAKGMNNRTYHCGVGDFSMIGHAEFEVVLSTAVQRFQQVSSIAMKGCAAKLLLLISCACPFDEIHYLEPHPAGDSILRKPPVASSVLPEDDLNQTCQSTLDTIRFHVPRVVLEALEFLRENETKANASQPTVNEFLQGITPYVTVAGIHGYMIYTGFERWNYSPVLPVFSHRGIGSRPGVFASYVRASSLFASMGTLYTFIDPSYKAPTSAATDGYGCSHVPKDGEVREYYRAWRQTFQPPNGASEQSLAAWHNGFVAGLHQFSCILFGGTRNYPGTPPDHALLPGSFIINHEKNHSVPTLWSQCLIEALEVYEVVKKVVQQRFKKVGLEIRWPLGDAYLFLSAANGTECTFVGVSATTTCAALEDYPPLARWAALHPNALRAFGMTKLYDGMRAHTHDIEAFYGRAPASLAPLRKHRLEDTSIKAQRLAIEATLMTYLQ